MSGYASFELPDADGKLIGGVFHIDRAPCGALCGLVLDAAERPISGATAVLFENSGATERPVGHTFTDSAGWFVLAPLKKGTAYTLRLWVGEELSATPAESQPPAEGDTPDAYRRYKQLYEK